MNDSPNPTRKTATWKLWLGGILGGMIVAVLAFYQGGDDPEQAKRMASTIGAWSVRLLLVGIVLAGGWSALRSRKPTG
jgi:hypothetical protein